jgi:pimeloyl-ACP methyl ester carboxylesterase
MPKTEEMQTIDARYVDHLGDQLYVVLHEAENPLAQILLAGPFPSERTFSYLPWNRWARYLAQRGIQALRFDYRGCGESTGAFEKQSLTGWIEDMTAAIAFLRSHTPGLPLVLHGLGFGGLLAAKLFSQQTGDALLLWSPPKSGREALRAALMRRLAIDFGLFPPGQRKSWKDYMAELDQTGVVNVEGFPCSRELWDEGNQLPLMVPAATEQPGGQADLRPWKLVNLDKTADPLIGGIGQWRPANPDGVNEHLRICPDLSTLYEANFQWIKKAIEPVGAAVK